MKRMIWLDRLHGGLSRALIVSGNITEVKNVYVCFLFCILNHVVGYGLVTRALIYRDRDG